MKFTLALLLTIVSIPALADDYQSGYDSGYYTGALAPADVSEYSNAVRDGGYDAYMEDKQTYQNNFDAYKASSDSAIPATDYSFYQYR